MGAPVVQLCSARRIGREVFRYRLRLRLAEAESCTRKSTLGTESSTGPGKLLPEVYGFSEDLSDFIYTQLCLLQIRAVFFFLSNLGAFHFFVLPYSTG